MYEKRWRTPLSGIVFLACRVHSPLASYVCWEVLLLLLGVLSWWETYSCYFEHSLFVFYFWSFLIGTQNIYLNSTYLKLFGFIYRNTYILRFGKFSSFFLKKKFILGLFEKQRQRSPICSPADICNFWNCARPKPGNKNLMWAPT